MSQATVLVDGNPRDSQSFKHNSGYVVQDDIVMGTVRAHLRLPLKSFSVASKLTSGIQADQWHPSCGHALE